MEKYIEIHSSSIEVEPKIVKCSTFVQVFKEIERCQKIPLNIAIKTEIEDKKIKLSAGLYRDKNKNTWDCNKFTELEALKAYDSLVNCRKCRDCINCTDSVDCINCVNCRNCVGCINIKNGINLENKFQQGE